MKLTKLSLVNFRGFEHLELGFSSDVNVIAGENGIGKSSILYALARLLSHVVNDFTVGKMPKQEFSDFDIRMKADGPAGWFQVSGDFFLADTNFNLSVDRIGLSAEQRKAFKEEIAKLELELPVVEGGNKRDRDKEIKRVKRDIAARKSVLSGGEERTSLIMAGLEVPGIEVDPRAADKALRDFMSGLKKLPNQPIAVYYTTRRFFNDSFKSIPTSPPFSVLRAYSNALEDLDVSLKDFAHWFHFASKNDKGARIADRMTEVVSEFIPEFRNLRLVDQAPIHFLVDKAGITLALTNLSDGERGLLAMVFDLTRRLALANPASDDPIGEGSAIVLIDEIELHLHPRWQQTVIPRLKDTFPKVQFIMTTHSPQALTSVHSSNIAIIREGKAFPAPGGMYGAESKRALERAMSVESRPQNERVEKLEELYRLIDQEEFERATTLAHALDLEFSGEEPAINEALTIIKNRIWEKEMGI